MLAVAVVFKFLGVFRNCEERSNLGLRDGLRVEEIASLSSQ